MKSIRINKKVIARTGSSPAVKRVITTTPAARASAPGKTVTNSMRESPIRSQTNIINSQQMILNAQRELEIARRMRMQAQRYLQETEIKARSEAQRLILHTRITIRKEIEDLVSQANEEVQKVLADIRVIRITAQEELAAQKKFTDAARLRSFTLSLQKEDTEPKERESKRTTAKKAAVH